MWSERKPWWQKKSKKNQTDTAVKKSWCVVRVAVGVKITLMHGEFIYTFKYVAVGKSNAPQFYNPETGKMEKCIEVNNLTKHEAYCVAKGLNFLDGETNAT